MDPILDAVTDTNLITFFNAVGLCAVRTNSSSPVNSASISLSASSPIATAAFKAYLNQLFFLSLSISSLYSSVGAPSDKRNIAGAYEPTTSAMNSFLESFSFKISKALPISVMPPALTKLHLKSLTSIGFGYIHLTPVENVSAAILINASALLSEISLISGNTPSIASLTSPILLPAILLDVSIKKNKIIVLLAIPSTLSYFPII